MTLRQSETLLRALVALALGVGFVGFATHTHGAHAAPTALSPAAAPLDSAATPIADVSIRAGL
jgi:hypothetical protein